MLTLLSPAKTLDYVTAPTTRKVSQPRLLERSVELIEVMRGKSVTEIADLMKISTELAALNLQRYQDFSPPLSRRNARAAVLAFNGEVYQGLAVRDRFDERDFTEAQKTVRILSGLYGVLRPLDLMQPYRLEMGLRLATPRGSSLYEFWGETITELLNADLAASPGPDVVVNLASAEYSRAVLAARLAGRLVSPVFLDERPDGGYAVVGFLAKRARGELASWLVRNRVRGVRPLRAFDGAGYRYDHQRSTPDVPVFLRPAGPARGWGRGP